MPPAMILVIRDDQVFTLPSTLFVLALGAACWNAHIYTSTSFSYNPTNLFLFYLTGKPQKDSDVTASIFCPALGALVGNEKDKYSLG